MHVAVVLRLVPDIAEDLDIIEAGNDIDREWVGMKLNEFDDHALEQAVLLKEQAGAGVTALALDGDGVDKLLQSAIARGADRIVKITHDELPPLPAAARIAALLAPALRALAPDVLLTGVQTPEDVGGQLAASLGALLGWPHVSAVAGLRPRGDGFAVRQEHSGGYAIQVDVPTPCVLGIQTASQPPRYVSGSKLRQAMGAKPELLAADDAAAPPAATVRALVRPEAAGGATLWEGDAEAVADQFLALLRKRGLLKG
jgi:electron transfer flavoprotein beta subunit